MSSPPAGDWVGGNQTLAGKPLNGRWMKFEKVSGLEGVHKCLGAAKCIGSQLALRITDIHSDGTLHNTPIRRTLLSSVLDQIGSQMRLTGKCSRKSEEHTTRSLRRCDRVRRKGIFDPVHDSVKLQRYTGLKDSLNRRISLHRKRNTIPPPCPSGLTSMASFLRPCEFCPFAAVHVLHCFGRRDTVESGI